MAMIGYVPFKIANGAAVSTAVDIGTGTARLVGLSIHGTWSSAFIAFQAYVPDTSTSTNPINPVTDTGAVYDYIRDDSGTTITVGTTGQTSALYYALGMSANKPASLEAARYIKVVSVTAAGTTGAPTTAAQGQAISGYLITRQD